MRSLFRPGLLLLAATVALALLHALFTVPDTRDFLSAVEWLRVLVGLPVVLFAPGIVLAPLLLGDDLREDEGPGLSFVRTLLGAVGLTLLAHALHFNLLRLLGLPIAWAPLLGLTAVELAAGLALLARRRPGLALGRPSPLVGAGLLTAALAVGAFSLWRGPDLTADPSWYFYNAGLQQGWLAPSEPAAVRIVRDDGERALDRLFRPVERVVSYRVENRGEATQRVPLFFLVHGRLGMTVELAVEGEVVHAEALGQLVKGPWSPAPVERYWDWGTVALAWSTDVDPGGDRIVELRIRPYLPGNQGLSEVAILDWSGIGSDEVARRMRARGLKHIHPFQLLNVTENVRWAAEVATDYVLPGRAPDGSSTLHQPPAWTYLYAPARVLTSPQGVSGSLLFVFILLAIAAAALQGVSANAPEARGSPLLGLLLGAALAAGALQHGSLIVSDGSMNFPDGMYALALLVSVTTLVSGRFRLFLLWAALAALLRYPGAVVVALACGVYLLTEKERREQAVDMLILFATGTAVFCGLMLMTALFTESLEKWLFALYFETVPEHFSNNPEALPLMERPVEFLNYWARVGGAVLVLALPLRGTLAKTACGAALLYAPFLAFIDHFSSHYFLPLIALAGTAAAANAARAGSSRARTTTAAAVAALAVALLLRSLSQTW